MNHVTEIAKALAQAQERYRLFALPPTARLLQELKPPQIFGTQEIARRLSEQHDVARTMTGGLARQITEIDANMRAITASIMPNWDLLCVNPWANLIGQHSPLEQFRSQIAEIEQIYGLLSMRLQSIASLPSVSAAQHFTRALELSQSWTKIGRPTGSLAASVATAEGEVAIQQADILEYPNVVDLGTLATEEDSQFADQPTLNLFEVQRNELIYIARKAPALLERDDVLDTLPTVDYFNTAQSVCRLIILINRQRDARGEEPIFKLTSRFVESLIVLPNLIANSRQLFGEFIDCLNLILYEGAGRDNLRFLGLIRNEDAGPIWTVKHFRNYDLRHDVDHGKPKEVAKKLADLATDYQSLIGVPLPRKRQDFRRTQLRLLKQVETMLRGISDAIEVLPPFSTATKE